MAKCCVCQKPVVVELIDLGGERLAHLACIQRGPRKRDRPEPREMMAERLKRRMVG